MNISLKEASAIISRSEDELMYFVQSEKVQVSISDSMQWQFDLDEILQLKQILETKDKEKESQDTQSSDE